MKWAGIGAALGALVGIAIFPVWQAWVNQFQTLITGIAAVLAATITIRTMERTDRESERRHRELVSIQTRPDRLKVSRALFPQIQDLRDIHFELSDLYDGKIEPPPGDDTREWSWVTEVSRRYLPRFDEIDRVLSRHQFQQGIVLFDGPTTRYLDELMEQNQVVRYTLHRHLEIVDAFDPTSNDHYHYHDGFADVFETAFVAIMLTVQLLKRLIASLEFTDRSYAVQGN
ncbi:MFS transporter [Rhizobium chutanense]|nr:MFS transporter [Rhizobium chutanense]